MSQALRALRITVLFALAGFACNVLVVGALASLVNIHETPPLGTYMRVDGHSCWVISAERPGVRHFEVRYEEPEANQGVSPVHFPPAWLRPTVPSAAELAPTGKAEIACDGRGWPLPSMWCEWKPLAGGAAVKISVRDGIELPLAPWRSVGMTTYPRLLPLRPILLGTAFNTLFYAVMLYGLFSALRGRVRLRRFFRGACPYCAYDLRADYSGICPECGRRCCRIAA